MNNEELEHQLRTDFTQAEFDLTLAAKWMRYAYAHGYTSGLADPEASKEKAHKQERQAWAMLP